jgi:beta-alanine degradation protein BauB
MRNLAIGLVLGISLGASATSLAQRGGAAATFPDAVTADPKHYSLSFENDIARFLRVKYEPGERSVMHQHLPGCVIFLTDQTFNFTIPDGTTDPASVPAGALGCSDGNVHLPENIGKETAEFIMVEFKDRMTFRK